MHKLELVRKKNNRWYWQVLSIRGKIKRVLAKSGEDYSQKAGAKRAYQQFPVGLQP